MSCIVLSSLNINNKQKTMNDVLNDSELMEISLIDLISEVGGDIDVTPKTKTVAIAWLRRLAREQEENLPLIKVIEEVKSRHWFYYIRYRGLGFKSLLFISLCVQKYFTLHNIVDPEVSEALKKSIENFRVSSLDTKDVLGQSKTFDELIKHRQRFASSNLYSQFFEKLVLLAETQEQLFYIVRNGFVSPAWPKAVRKLAELPSLKPFPFDYKL